MEVRDSRTCLRKALQSSMAEMWSTRRGEVRDDGGDPDRVPNPKDLMSQSRKWNFIPRTMWSHRKVFYS